MIGLMLATVLTAAPNIFEPKEMSSEAIVGAVATCMSIGVDASGVAHKAELIAACGCVIDAVRANTKKGLKPPDNNATDTQLKRCYAHIKERMKARDTERTPRP